MENKIYLEKSRNIIGYSKEILSQRTIIILEKPLVSNGWILEKEIMHFPSNNNFKNCLVLTLTDNDKFSDTIEKCNFGSLEDFLCSLEYYIEDFSKFNTWKEYKIDQYLGKFKNSVAKLDVKSFDSGTIWELDKQIKTLRETLEMHT